MVRLLSCHNQWFRTHDLQVLSFLCSIYLRDSSVVWQLLSDLICAVPTPDLYTIIVGTSDPSNHPLALPGETAIRHATISTTCLGTVCNPKSQEYLDTKHHFCILS